MERTFFSFPIADFQQTKWQMLNWGNRFNICCFLDNHEYLSSHHTIDCLLAAGSVRQLTANAGSALEQLQAFSAENRDWIFGHLAYDLKNETESLTSSNPDRIGFADLCFFVPEYLVQLSATEISIGSLRDDHRQVFSAIIETAKHPSPDKRMTAPVIRSGFSREDYLATVEKLRAHILRGDCYEVNLCQEFYAAEVSVDPVQLYIRLSHTSPNPFSAFYKIDDRFLACLSPERYLKKEGLRLISQPIKGTAARDASPEKDAANREWLRNSEKERAENIMVVDLVRNDLSRVCKTGTVRVDELCGIYSFPQVHQMVSTVSGELSGTTGIADVIRASFPMGSMTGAPKKRVMELIESYELSRRGLFSGSIGYITPEKDFDFNVVIRSVCVNTTRGTLSFHTGSAITFNSEPEKEYEECLLKAAAIKKALAETNTFH